MTNEIDAIRRIRIAWIFGLGLAMAMGVMACSGDSANGRAGQGVVLQVDAAGRKITLDHGDIPGMMKAMTMTFDVAPGVSLEGLAQGDEVDFRLKHEGGRYIVTELRTDGG